MWTCPRCSQENDQNFCQKCGFAKEAVVHFTSDQGRINRTKHFFNKGLFDRKDPTESIGILLPGFSFYHLYSNIGKEKIDHVSAELYSSVLRKLQSNVPNKVSYDIVRYADRKHEPVEGYRDYIVVTRETPRKTRATIVARCIPQGENLYVAVESYVLGSLDKWNLLRRLIFSLIPLLLLACPLGFAALNIMQALVVSPFGGDRPGIASILAPVFWCALPLLAIIAVLWIDVIRGFSQHKDLPLAFRETFNTFPISESFNIDDIFGFFKSVLPNVVYSVRDTFKDNQIEIESLDEFISNIQNVTNINQTFNNAMSNYGAQGVQSGSVSVNNMPKPKN